MLEGAGLLKAVDSEKNDQTGDSISIVERYRQVCTCFGQSDNIIWLCLDLLISSELLTYVDLWKTSMSAILESVDRFQGFRPRGHTFEATNIVQNSCKR